MSSAAFQRLSLVGFISIQTLVLQLESLKGTLPSEGEEVKFISKELQTLNQSAKALLEPFFNVESLPEGLEDSNVLAALTHLTDIYLQGRRLALRFLPSQSASGAVSHHLSGTMVCLAELFWLTLPTFDGHLPVWQDFCSKFITLVHENVALTPKQKWLYL